MGAIQGHSGQAASMLRMGSVLNLAALEDSRVPHVMVHGTQARHAHKIRGEGLKAGGEAGSSARVHIHLVSRIEGTARRAGARSGSDTIARVDIRRYMEDGGRCDWSRNEVLLTEGMVRDGQNYGIEPKCILGIHGLFTGREIDPLPVPELTKDGAAPMPGR